MIQRLWLQHHHPHLQPPPFHHHHHLHLSVSLLMGEQTLSQTQHSAPSPAAPATTTAAPSLPSSTPTSSTASTTAVAKIPFRPRKVRKVSSQGDATQPDVKTPPVNRVALRVLPRPLTAEGEIAAALRHLRAADPHLAPVIDAQDPPTFQSIHPPFHSLARSILYQQLAFKAAASIYSRFISLCGGEAGVVPEVVLALTPHQLRQIGVSGRKASYLHDLARKYHGGILSDSTIVAMDDKSLFSMLTMVKGIGAWSVHMFMIFSLHRPDVLPIGDLGVRKGVQILYGLEDTPRPSQMEQLCERWRPYRSVGSWFMWRLVEAKGSAAVAPAGAGGLPIAGGLGGAVGTTTHHPQPLIIDPIQMLPNIGIMHKPIHSDPIDLDSIDIVKEWVVELEEPALEGIEGEIDNWMEMDPSVEGANDDQELGEIGEVNEEDEDVGEELDDYEGEDY